MDAPTVNPEAVVFSYHFFLGTSVNREGKKELLIGLVSPVEGTPYAYAFKGTGEALEFVEDMKVLIKKIDQEEAENNAGRD